MYNCININGRILSASDAAISLADLSNHAGCFETMRLVVDHIPLWHYHYSRFTRSVSRLGFSTRNLPAKDELLKQVLELPRLNHHSQARIRLRCYANEDSVDYSIESFPAEAITFNSVGLNLGIYHQTTKTIDELSMVKLNARPLYQLASAEATKQGLDEMLIVNNQGRIAEACIYNLFIYRQERLITPALTEGCVEGVMRNYLLDTLPKNGFGVEESSLTVADIETAEEVFLTNAFRGINWVQSLGAKRYSNKMSSGLFRSFIAPNFNS